MFLKKLSLVNFKNYAEFEYEFGREVTCFYGLNGAGKTNVLDAIYYLSNCKSYFNPVDSQNIRFDEKFFLIQGEIEKEGKTANLHVGVKKGHKKSVKKNKVEYEKLSDHIGHFPTVVVSPYDIDLILEGSETRRRLMDYIISQYDKKYLEALIKYKKIVQQRNSLLKRFAEQRLFEPESIEIWDYQMIPLGNYIFEARKLFLDEFIVKFKEVYREIAGTDEDVSLIYRSDLLEGDFGQILKDSYQSDHYKQHTTRGIHRDDLTFQIHGQPIKKFGSQGQQKTFLIALKLSKFDYLKEILGVKPFLLLDDIFDKLDENRVAHLMKLVSEHNFGQVFITDTEKNRVEQAFNKWEIEIDFKEILKYEQEKVE
ncbi:MAG: DNA replication and repair protein RecF [Crocinitomicaceae bacterium]|nr:DNA replication and repair protein RecF [Crocinitomicaceae bacterium]